MSATPIRGLKAALNASGRFKYKTPEFTIDHLVIGGGVVGLALAQRLCSLFPNQSTYLVEKHSHFGNETSSRNSEVIHSGLYYPPDSLKTRLCLRGREILYSHCEQNAIPFKRTGKLVVATEGQHAYIENLHKKSLKLTWPPGPSSPDDVPLPTKLISGDEAREMEPDLSKGIISALWSPTTGIIDSHALMENLEKMVMDAEGGDLVYSTRVVRVDPSPDQKEQGWVVQLVTGDAAEGDALLARNVYNCGGLSAPLIVNALLPEDQRIPMYYAKGSYASYRGPGISKVSRLIYPCPDTRSETQHGFGFQSLGTHLTLDLDGNIKFGPDIEFIEPPSNDEEATEFWWKHLSPDDSRMREIQSSVNQYLPGVQLDGLQPDYVGFRPKLVGPTGGFQDFVFRLDRAGSSPMISMLGIESPGLTSSLAIAEYVTDTLMKK